MTGGLIQIVAYGSQDLFLTGIPEITFFKYIYKRYTNFAEETIDIKYDGIGNFDEDISAKLVTVHDKEFNAWDVSSVTDFSNMFNGATGFNKDISSWAPIINKNPDFNHMFNGATNFSSNNALAILSYIEDDVKWPNLFGQPSKKLLNMFKGVNLNNDSIRIARDFWFRIPDDGGQVYLFGNINNWRTEKVENMSNLFPENSTNYKFDNTDKF